MQLTSKFRWSFCCCMSRRSGTLIAGIIDIILGILCILATMAILAQNLTEQAALQETEMNEEKVIGLQQLIAGFILIVIACGLPALITLVTGIVSIISTSSKNPCFAAYAVALNFLLVITLAGTTIFLFVLGLRTSLLIVYCVSTLLQIYFALVLFNFYKLRTSWRSQQKSQEELTINATGEGEEGRKLAGSDA